MSIISRMRILAVSAIASAALVTTVCSAQQPITVNGVSCTAANAVTVTYSGGALNISTGGCGTTTVVVPPSTSPPTISSVSPGSGAPNDTITINGLNLSGAQVKIGGVSATVLTTSSTQIVLKVPSILPNSSAGITVTTGIAPDFTFAFSVTAPSATPAPVISTVSPLSGQVGTALTIAGSGFTGAGVTIGGVPANITGITSTTITTTVPANVPAGVANIIVTTASGNSSINFTVTALVQQPTGADVSIDGHTLANPSKLGNVDLLPHQGLNGAGFAVNAYAMDPTRCVATPALTRSWQHNISLDDYQDKHALDYIAMRSGEALTFKFTVPLGSYDKGGGFQYADAAAAGANIRPGFMSVSTTPCDFDTTKVLTNTSGNGCYVTGINGVTVNWANITGTLPVSYCKLEKGKTYYLNLRFQDARPASAGGNPNTDACFNGETCGGILQFF